MSVEYWVCQGIGFEQNAIVPFLDAEKLEKLIEEKAENSYVDEEFKAENDYDHLDNGARITLLIDDIVCNENYQLAGLLAAANEEQVLRAETDDNGRYFLLYPPRYPWGNTGEFASQEYLVEYIAEQVKPFCRDNITLQEIINIIDTDVYEVGCG